MDSLGGNGNGERWFAANDSAITNHPYYQEYSQQIIGTIDVAVLKQLIGQMYPSTEAAPIVNYLQWVLEACLAVA